MLNILKILFFLGLGIGLIWLALRKTTDEEFANIKISLLNADYFWISLSILITGLSHFFRALRWKLLLDPLGYKPKTSNTFFAVMVGYLANFAIHRMGEVTRCGLLTTYEKVPFTTGFGSVISERALDVVCLIIIFFAALGMEFDRISGIANDLVFNTVAEKFHLLMQKQTFVISAGISLLVIAITIFYFRKKIHRTKSNCQNYRSIKSPLSRYSSLRLLCCLPSHQPRLRVRDCRAQRARRCNGIKFRSLSGSRLESGSMRLRV